MTATISGYRADGNRWPVAGDPLVTDEDEALHLIRGDMARPWPGGDDPPAEEPAPVEEEETPVEEAEAVQSEEEPPKAVAPKADWVAWAVSQGMAEADAQAATKASLMEDYGTRA